MAGVVLKFLLVLLLVVGSSFGVKFPHYMQCDPLWGNDTMGVPNQAGDDTICHQGCAMSCVAMALTGYGYTIEGQEITPKVLNKWLRSNNGYTCISGDCCNLVLSAPDKLNPDRIRNLGEPLVPFLPTLKAFVRDQLVVLAHVQHQHHFVLITGIDESAPDSFFVLDPFYNRTTYQYNEIHDVILYDILLAKN